ncbi:RAMP superfamily CRISPR-associated protein [Aeribacillus pallidus]|uniref:RAMP superfamily CRISPR-associated protein n=1 Tax=unclassified Aeribacillus TaxID=2640495 RepID=UPI0030DA3ACD
MNHIATVEIELLSETVFGGNSNQAGTVDIDLQTDEYGFPYYAGRTLKGVLREQADWYVSKLSQFEDSTKAKRALDKLFGSPDSSDRTIHRHNHSSLRFGDAKLSQHLYDFVMENGIDRKQVLRALTTVRSMTSLDDETGTAKNGSLRQVRAVFPGYRFYAPVFTQGTLNDEEKELLEVAVKLVRYVGIMRHRGKGHVRCTLHWHRGMDKIEARAASKVGFSHPYLTLTIDVCEPLKISHILGTSDSTHALHYIPGYVLRGALVHTYLQATGMSPEKLDTRVIFDHRKVQFWNGYIKINGERSLPFAQHLFETKEESKKKTTNPRRVYNAMDEKEMNLIRSDSPVKIKRDAMLLESNQQLTGQTVKTTSSLHMSINGNRNDADKRHLYRYEAISPKQTFEAIVSVKESDPFVDWLCKQKELTVWIGGARNSGYGRCIIRVGFANDHPEQRWVHIDDLAGSQELYVLATSDWIIRNEFGQLVSALDDKWLGEQLGVSLELKNQVVQTQLTGGYISQWQAYQPMIRAVKAGSVYHYEVKSGKIDVNKLMALTERGVGERRNEGFGRLMILPGWSYHYLKEAKEEVRMPIPLQKIEEQDGSQLLRLKEGLLREMLTHFMRMKVSEWKRELTGADHLTSSQWGKLLQHSSQFLHQPKEKRTSRFLKTYWEKFWEDTSRRLKAKSKLSFDGVRVGNKKLKDFILELIDQKWEVDQRLAEQVEVNYAEWNMRALELLIRQVIRSKNEKREVEHQHAARV